MVASTISPDEQPIRALGQSAATESLPSDIAPQILAIVAKAAPAQRRIIARIPGYDVDDLAGESILKIVRGFHTFNPARGASLRTWITNVVRNAAFDRLRQHKRQSNISTMERLKQRAAPMPDEQLIEFIEEVYRRFCDKYPQRPRQFYKGFTKPQKLAFGILIFKTGMSTRDAAAWLEEHPGVCRALELKKLPDHTTLHRFHVLAKITVAEFEEKKKK